MMQVKNKPAMKWIYNVTLSFLFLAMLIFPTVQSLFGVFPALESKENKSPAAKPRMRIDNLDAFPAAYENYFNDSFSLKNHFVKLKSLIFFKLLHQSPLPEKVILGRDNWLFLVKDELETYRGTNILQEKELELLSDEFKRRKKYLDEHGIRLYIFVAPIKYHIYPEYLPENLDKLRTPNITDQIIAHLTKNGIPIYDLHDPIIALKKENLLYYKTDNHWNSYGSFAAYQAIITQIREDFPALPLLSLNDFRITRSELKVGNLSRLIDLEKQFNDTGYDFEPVSAYSARKSANKKYPVPTAFPYKWDYELTFETGRDSLPDLLMIRDSFGADIIPYLSESFNKSVYIFDNWKYRLNERIVENEKPDIMVYLIVENMWNAMLIGIREPADKDFR